MRKKVFRDPIHNYIDVTHQVIWDVINTPAFQRLNNIKQLGGAFQIFHGAMHTRFGHSLGAYTIARQMVEKVNGLEASLTSREQLLLYCAALLHDVGHGPFSHASESFLKLHHEEMSCRIILEDPAIRQALDQVDDNFAADIVKVLQKQYENPLLAKIVSSQVDVDRMDYLLRDSYYAGVPYGKYDKDRIIHVMEVAKGSIVFRESGIYAVEDFMLSRYHMSAQVYMNAKGRVFEILMTHSVARFLHLWHEKKLTNQKLYQLFYNFVMMDYTTDVAHFLAFDDQMFSSTQRLFQTEEDVILSQLASDITSRTLPKAFELPDKESFLEIQEALRLLVLQESELPFFIYCEELVEKSVYYSDKESDIVYVQRPNNDVVAIEEVSSVIYALGEKMLENKYYVYINQKYIKKEHKTYVDTLKAVGIIA